MGFGAYIAMVIVCAAATVGVTVSVVLLTVRIIARQVKLYHSINLVELKTSKLVFIIFAGSVGFLIIYIIWQMAKVDSQTTLLFVELFGVGKTETNIALMFALIIAIATETLLVALTFCKNAVVDKGVYTNTDLLDWHRVRDYMIDEEKCVLVLSSDRNTFSTLRRLTPPFRFKKSDVEKLKFILNKNKNKFSGFDE